MIQMLQVPECIMQVEWPKDMPLLQLLQGPASPDLLLPVPSTTAEHLFLLYIHIFRKGKGIGLPLAKRSFPLVQCL